MQTERKGERDRGRVTEPETGQQRKGMTDRRRDGDTRIHTETER